jgi:hypothetical protein
MAQQDQMGVEIPHDKVIKALSDRYARALAELHQECAQLTAGIEVAVAERNEARQQYAELVADRQKAKLARVDPLIRPRPIVDNPQA